MRSDIWDRTRLACFDWSSRLHTGRIARKYARETRALYHSKLSKARRTELPNFASRLSASDRDRFARAINSATRRSSPADLKTSDASSTRPHAFTTRLHQP